MSRSSPELVIQRQLDAYNARDLDALLNVYAEDAELFEHPNTLIARARCAPRAFHRAFRGTEPARGLAASDGCRKNGHRPREGHAHVPEGSGELELVMIYSVSDGRIAKAWSIAGEKRLFG